MLDQAHSRKPTNTFTFKLALGDTNEICSGELPDLCLEAISQFPDNEKIKDFENCENICNLVGQYSEDPDKLDAEVVSDKELICQLPTDEIE